MSTEAARYLTAARNVPTLERKQEQDLLRRFRLHGDRHAAETIARAYQRSVISLALKFRRDNVSLGDLIGEGNMGLLRALEKFEIERDVRFGTYAAYWIRAQMLAHVIKSRSTVGGTTGAWRTQMFYKVRRERARMTSQFGPGHIADQALAERLGLSLKRVQSMLQRLDNHDVSIESGHGDPGSTLLHTLESESNQEEELFRHQFDQGLQQIIDGALGELDAREFYIVQHRLMVSDSDQLSLAEIARRFGISRERARQLERRAVFKLRRAIEAANYPQVNEWLRDTAAGRQSSLAPRHTQRRGGMG